MRGWLWLSSLLLGSHLLAWGQAEIKLARYPAPSPDGRLIAFCWQGDLWIVGAEGGVAQRWTVHEAYDYAPCWSPDGSRIAFTSDRHGNDDVFILHLGDGSVQRLTHFSGRDRALGWLPDGSAVLFASHRDGEPYGAGDRLYAALLQGGTPSRFGEADGTPAALSPDGSRLAFVRRGSPWWRKHYRGSGAGDLWLHDLAAGSFSRLTDFEGPDDTPLWAPDGQTLYFLSERDGTYNLWRLPAGGGGPQQVTHYRDDGVRFPAIAANGSLIAYEQGLDLWALPLPDGEPRRLQIVAPTDLRRPQVEWRTYTGEASEFAVAPGGKEVAFVVRGEVFATRFPEGGVTRRVTETVEPEGGLTWSADGRTLVYSSERGGQTDLYLATSGDPEEPRLRRTAQLREERLTATPESERAPEFSPNGRRLAFVRGAGDLVVMDWETKQEKTILTGWNLDGYRWSPDSRWIAFSRDDNEFNTDVFLLSVDGGEPVNVSRHPDEDWAPSWSADGRVLTFLSRRKGDDADIFLVFLQKSEHEKTKADREDEEDAKFDAPRKGQQPESGGQEAGDKEQVAEPKSPPEPKPIRIDLEDIHERVRQVTNLEGDEAEPMPSPDGKTIAFRSGYQGQSDLYTVKWDGSEEKRLTTGGRVPAALRWSSDGKSLYFLSRGALSRVAAGGGNLETTAFTARLRIDRAAERRYLYEAVWQTLNEEFYDPGFHGADWTALREKYRPWAEQASSERDFSTVVYLLLGELNASHVGFSLPGASTSDPSDTGMLGVVWSNRRDGDGLLIERVLPDTPASRSDVNLQPGERVLAVNGEPITATRNVWALLDHTPGEKTALRVRGADGAERTVVLRPISIGAFEQAVYRDWVKRSRRFVEEKSGGQLAYVHIQAMGQTSLDDFERDLYAVAHGKQGLLIDVRFNGGGSTADYLLAILNVRRHAYTVARTSGPGYPQDRLPLYAWTRPAAVLCNERSFSNAEIFAHAFKTLRRGPLIGYPTFGGVISTGGRTLVDGSSVRTPGRGWFVIDTGLDMENHGAVPDYVVEDLPEDAGQSRDRQLEKAVEVMLEQISTAPPEFPDGPPG